MPVYLIGRRHPFSAPHQSQCDLPTSVPKRRRTSKTCTAKAEDCWHVTILWQGDISKAVDRDFKANEQQHTLLTPHHSSNALATLISTNYQKCRQLNTNGTSLDKKSPLNPTQPPPLLPHSPKTQPPFNPIAKLCNRSITAPPQAAISLSIKLPNNPTATSSLSPNLNLSSTFLQAASPGPAHSSP